MSYVLSLLFFWGATSSMSGAVGEFRLLQAPTFFNNETSDTAENKEKDETIIQTSYNALEKTGIVAEMNALRLSVGASDMTAVSWDDTMEADAARFTAKCNYDALIATTGWGIIEYSTVKIIAAISLSRIFIDPTFFLGMRSVYLEGIGVNTRFCSSAKVDGRTRYNIYIGAYFFSHTSQFNDKVPQYRIGEACTTCRSHVFWCHGGFCDGSCVSQLIDTCSCFSNCTLCEDWDTNLCTCPSQPMTDAATLDCYNQGEMAFKAAASWVMIVASTLALLGLQ